MTSLMWSYQTHFCGAQQAAARRLFLELDPRLDPQVFLVGFLARPSQSRPPVCLEPGEDFWLTADDFQDVELVHRHGFVCQLGDPTASDSSVGLQSELQLRRSMRDAVACSIVKHTALSAEMSYQVSMPSRVERYWVCAAVGLPHAALRSHVSMRNPEIHAHGRKLRLATSLIDAAMLEFLESTTLELARPQPGRELSHIDPEDILRAAGRRLMNSIVWRIDESSVEGIPDLFRTFTTVSSLAYERKAGSGSIFVARRGHAALESRLEFSASARIRHHTHARKLLELTSADLVLHSDSDRIFGLAHVDRSRLDAEDIFEARISGHHHWELLRAGRPLMRVQYGQPSLPKTRVDAEKLRIDLVRIFPGITPEQIDNLVGLVESAIEESHGTMLLISASASSEARRLSAQCIPVKPRQMTADLLRNVTPIDGAVLLSHEGRCYAIGTILDGIAAANGDPSRGARYNSAVRYVESTEAPCLAVVVSEDGRVDYVPDLRVPISRLEIENRLAALERVLASGRVKRRVYYEIVTWFDAHRFYLLKEHCEKLNNLISSIEAMFESSDPHVLTNVHALYNPHPHMDPELYYMRTERISPTATVQA
ncbi:MAG: diadenylate cyclase [Planctomycetaceae bacterium]